MKVILIILVIFFGASFIFSVILKKMRRAFIGDVEEQRKELKQKKKEK